MHAGRPEEARAALDLVDADEDIVESDRDYKKRVLLYKGLTKPEEFLEQLDTSYSLFTLTELYALANDYRFIVGDEQKCIEYLKQVLATPDHHQAYAYKTALLDMAVLEKGE